MINFEEELKKFHPSTEIEELEEYVNKQDLTDMTDIMKEIMGYVGSFQASVENAYDEKMIKTMKDLYGSEEVQKAKSEGNMEKLYQIFFDAYSKIQNEYVNSDEYKSLENAQLGAVDKLQESLAPRYQDYGYRMGLAFNEGLASTEYMQKNTAGFSQPYF